ncbi:CheR family methyltransferase [Gilvimarinus polysaccharolyticus]|uniref:CheR family methyltransferase n=1 Tax=Gilvimarinus polysaccharolyticus TaxID=863921 RepID=UPI0006735EC9|nr:protein-glutamate O-methyltransferase CheR [Gilvimarinus polysaccharolyticus]
MTTDRTAQGGTLAQVEFDHFREFLQDACGISLGENKQYLVTNRVRRLLEEHNLESFSELVGVLKRNSNRRLRDQVIDVMTTNETFWFRDNYPFEYLKSTILPDLMQPSKRMFGPIRVWSAACSSGQEPYSLSMTVDEYRRRAMGALARPVQIVATDLSSIVLEQARQGIYDKLSVMRGLSQERRDAYFEPLDGDRWQVKPKLRECIEFKAINLLDSYAALGRFDIVFCRNVLIYFDAALKTRILEKIHASLKPGGIVFLGSSEGVAGASHLFEMIRCEPGILYRAL